MTFMSEAFKYLAAAIAAGLAALAAWLGLTVRLSERQLKVWLVNLKVRVI